MGVFISFAAAGVVLAVFPIAAEKELDLGKKIVGFVFMSRAVMLSFGLWLMGRMRFWHFKGPQMAAGLCALALVSLALIFAESIGMVFILFGCLGILMAHAYANSQFHGLSGSSNRAFSMAIHEAVVGLGVFCGSMVGGMIYQKTGMRAVYASLALAIVLTIAIQIAIFQSHKKAAYI